MAAAGIVAAPVHAQMQSPRACDLRKRIDNEAAPLPRPRPAASRVSTERAGDLMLSKADYAERPTSIIKPATGESDNEVQLKLSQAATQDSSAIVSQSDGGERTRALSARLLAAEADLRAADDRRETLEKEREAWLSERKLRTAERELLVYAALLMRDACDSTESETEHALDRLLVAVGATKVTIVDSDKTTARELARDATTAKGYAGAGDNFEKSSPEERGEGDASEYEMISFTDDEKRSSPAAAKVRCDGSAQNGPLRRLLRQEMAAASERRLRRAERVAALRARVPAEASQLFAKILSRDKTNTQAAGGSNSLTVIEDIDARLASDAHHLSVGDTSALADKGSHEPRESLLLSEFLKVYEMVRDFQREMERIIKRTGDASYLVTGQEPARRDKAEPTMNQIQTMTVDIGQVLTNACTAMEAALSTDYAASSGPVSQSPEVGMQVSASHGSKNNNSESVAPTSKGDESRIAHEAQIANLQQQIVNMHTEQTITKEVQNDDTRSGALLISAMQGHVRDLQAQVAAAATTAAAAAAGSRTGSSAEEDAAARGREGARVVFTRLDAERNTKTIKLALSHNRLSSRQAAEAIERMDAYLDVPQQRFIELAKKYVHRESIGPADAAGATRAEHRLERRDRELLHKMETLQALRHKQWRQKMETLGTQQTELADGLVEALESIERSSGIFLIKPTAYSQRRRAFEQRHKSATVDARTTENGSSLEASNARQEDSRRQPPTVGDRRRAYSSLDVSEPLQAYAAVKHRGGHAHRRSSGGTETGLFPTRSATALHRPKAVTRSSVATWTNVPPPRPPPEETTADARQAAAGGTSGGVSWLAAPRILAMDINRFTFGHERAATAVAAAANPTPRGHRNVSSATTRSYLTVTRTAPPPRAGAASGTGSGLADRHGQTSKLGWTPLGVTGSQAAAAAAAAFDVPTHERRKAVEPVNVLGPAAATRGDIEAAAAAADEGEEEAAAAADDEAADESPRIT